MKYVITGSIGHISKPVVNSLVKAGHEVTVLTSNTERIKEIESLGAIAAVGSVEDVKFLSTAFAGMDAAYLMIPPIWAPKEGWFTFQKKVADNYAEAIKSSGIKSIVLLSSVGAHLGKGTGPVDGVAYAERKLKELSNVNIKVLRPSYFYYNLLNMIPLMKHAGIMGSNFGNTDEKLILTDTDDIAEIAGNRLLNLNFSGFSIEYIASDERHPKEIADVLSKAVGKPGIPWVTFTDEQTLDGMLKAGLDAGIANGYVEMGAALRFGIVQEDFWKNRPQLGKVKLEDFAKKFAAAYNAPQ